MNWDLEVEHQQQAKVAVDWVKQVHYRYDGHRKRNLMEDYLRYAGNSSVLEAGGAKHCVATAGLQADPRQLPGTAGDARPRFMFPLMQGISPAGTTASTSETCGTAMRSCLPRRVHRFST